MRFFFSLSQSRCAFKQVALTSALNKPRIWCYDTAPACMLGGMDVLQNNDLMYAHPLGNKFLLFLSFASPKKESFLSFCSVCSALRFCRGPHFSECHCNKNAFHSQFSRSLHRTSSNYTFMRRRIFHTVALGPRFP